MKVKLYVHATFDVKGHHTGYSLWPWKDPYNSDFSTGFSAHVGEMEVEVPDYPPSDLDRAALATLRKHRDSLSAEHQNMMTKLQVLENNLLRLPSADVLDSVEVDRNGRPRFDPRRPASDNDLDDDIPF